MTSTSLFPLPSNLSAADQRELQIRLDELITHLRRALLEDLAQGTISFSLSKKLLLRVSPAKQVELRAKAAGLLAQQPIAPVVGVLPGVDAPGPVPFLAGPSNSPKPVPGSWNGPKRVTLVLDWIKCVKDTNDPAKDHMSIGGMQLDLGALEEGRVPAIDLGKFKKGELKSDNISICSVDLSNAKSFPTQAKAVLYLAEKDMESVFVDFLAEIHKAARKWLEDYLRDNDIGDDGGTNPTWWQVLTLAILISADALFALLYQVFADDIFSTPIELTSPAILDADNSDETWGGDLRSKTIARTVHGFGGTYKLGFFWRREQ